jgi:hypothetical protein
VARNPTIQIVVEAARKHVSTLTGRFGTRIVQVLAGTPGQGGTPRDTEHASSNWIATTGAPFVGVVGSKEAVSRAVQGTGLAMLALYDVSDGPVFIVNNVAYIRPLNNGSSRQAPAGFVQAGVAKAAAQVKAGL